MRFFSHFSGKRLTLPKFKTPGYPDGGPYVGESLLDYHHRKWAALDPEIRQRAVNYLRQELAPGNRKEWRGTMENNPEYWCSDHHMFAGVTFRNLLRDVIKDAELPTGNWDDYYATALEVAVGFYAGV